MSKDLTKMLSELQYHEALDRSRVFFNNIDMNLLQHPVCKLDKEISNKVEECLNALHAVYQIIESRGKDA